MKRLFWPPAALLLAVLAVVQIRSSLRESNIADETTELTAGYSYLTRGDFRLNPEHPPLTKLLAALPLLKFRLIFPDSPSWRQDDELHFGVEFFDVNARAVDTFLFAARLPSILMTSCLGLALALWTRANFGATAALIALALYAFDPTITAHGRYVKNDVPLALFAFLACIGWGAFLKTPNARRFLAASIALGLAFATKFSALFLLPVFVILAAIRWWQKPKDMPLRLAILSSIGAAILAGAVVFVVYAIPAGIHGVRLGGFHFRDLHNLFDRSESGALTRIAQPPIGAHPFVQGLTIYLDHNAVGHPAYLLGMHSMKGWWYYFPIAFAVKTPVATLAFLGLAAWAGARMVCAVKLRTASFSWFVLAAPLTVFGSFCLASHIDIGIRHLLPAFPFLFVLASAIFTRARFHIAPAILPLLGAGLAIESISIYPHYLAFFNVLSGGPARGARILADSNIDWGQDAKELRAWLSAHWSTYRAEPLCVDYFGTAKLDWLGIRGQSLAEKWKNDRRVSLDCVAAVSVNQLEGAYINPGDYAWLREVPPDARIGYSIYIYDLPRRAKLESLPLQHFAPTPKFVGVLHQDRRGPPTAGDPARRGEILLFFMTGLGPVNPPVPEHQPAPEGRLGYTELPLLCEWNALEGGREAEVLYSGSSPGQTGIYQVNVRVPQVASEVPLTCEAGLLSGKRSEPASIMVPIGE